MNTPRVPAGCALATALAGLLLAAGCAKQQQAAPAAPALSASLPGGLAPRASVLDLMLDLVDPNADELWESVATISTRAGVEERRPRTDEQWQAARRRAMTLVETANLLVIDGRQVARPGQTLDDPPGQGDFTPAQSQAAIDTDRASFVGFARAFQGAAGEMLDAIEKRDADALLQTGGVLDEACENCHRRFWYPNSPLPPGV